MKQLLRQILMLSAILLLIHACKKDDEVSIEEPSLDRYIGDYMVYSTHTARYYQLYDSVGNFLGLEEQVTEKIDSVLTISRMDEDTLKINGLIKGLYGDFRQEVKAVEENDTLNIIFEMSTATRNNYIRGQIWLDEDSLHLDYRWNRSDTWSGYAIPEMGEVEGSGMRP